MQKMFAKIRSEMSSTVTISVKYSNTHSTCEHSYYYRYLDVNIKTHIRNPHPNLKDDETFIESNKLHGEDEHTQKCTSQHHIQ